MHKVHVADLDYVVDDDISVSQNDILFVLRLCCLDCAIENDSNNIEPGTCYLDCICVEEKFRWKGIGKTLMETANNEARKHACRVRP